MTKNYKFHLGVPLREEVRAMKGKYLAEEEMIAKVYADNSSDLSEFEFSDNDASRSNLPAYRSKEDVVK